MSTSIVMLPKHFADSSSFVFHGILVTVLRVFLRVLMILLLVPVLLLYAGTAVPWIFTFLLLAIDGFLLWRLFRHTYAGGRECLLLFAIVSVASVAVMLSQSYAETPKLADAMGQLPAHSIAVLSVKRCCRRRV